MTYKEKVEWLLSYRRQQQRVEELSREMQEMEQVMQSQREQLAVGRNGDWKRARLRPRIPQNMAFFPCGVQFLRMVTMWFVTVGLWPNVPHRTAAILKNS